MVAIACCVALGALQVQAAKRSDRGPGEPTSGGVSERLSRVFEERRRDSRSLGVVAASHGVRSHDNRVLVDVVLDGYAPGLADAIEAAGGTVRAISAKYQRASVAVADSGALAAIADLPQVQYIYPEYGAVRRTGSVESRAFEALTVDGLPPGLTGAGQTIGILADSFARTGNVVDGDTTTNGSTIDPDGNTAPVTLEGAKPQDSGDLPAVVELRRDDADPLAGPLTDEGAAMAELIHDLAPGADIAFYSAFVSFAEFAAGIDDLCGKAGADIVVDDVLYVAELMYQDDIISSAAEDCVQSGIAFFSAAGNNADTAFHRVYRDVDAFDTNNDGAASEFKGDFHDWNPDAGGDSLLGITLKDGEAFRAVLQWNQPALSVPDNDNNGPQVDLDLYLLDSAGKVLDSSFEDQVASNGSGGADPIEVVEYLNSTGVDQDVFLGIDHWAGSQDRIPQDEGTELEFRLVLFEIGAPSYEYTPTDSTMYGHPVADGVISVGAVPWWEAPAFDPAGGATREIDPEPFTAKGGSLQAHFRPNGAFFRRTRAPQPYLAAVDGNNNTFLGDDIDPVAGTETDTDPNFFGTSAAAPNAAAVAALLLEDDGTLQPADIAARLMTSAVDVTGMNASTGCDDRTGAGLIDATAAQSADDSAPTAMAGDDQDVKGGNTVTLDGSGSTDNNAVDAFKWTQVKGKRVSLSNPDGAQTEFSAPASDADLVFELRVIDAACLSDSDRITVTVKGSGGGGGGVGPPLLVLLALGLGGSVRRASCRGRPASRERA